MDLKTTLLAINALLGVLYLGLPLFIAVGAFNLIFWAGMVYNFATSSEDKILDELLAKRAVYTPTDEQIEFERFLIRNYTESHFVDIEQANQENPALEQPITSPVEA